MQHILYVFSKSKKLERIYKVKSNILKYFILNNINYLIKIIIFEIL